MGVKLYYGGYGEYQVFAVAETEAKAIEVIGRKINAPFLPIEAKCISEVDGYEIFAKAPKEIEEQGEAKPEAKAEEPKEKVFKCKHCGKEFDNWGNLMAHYRSSHPQGG